MSCAELVCRSNFSFLTGASHPEELVARASELGYRALALTDECSLAGIVRAHKAAQVAGLPLICGSLFTLTDPEHPAQPVRLAALAPTRSAYAELSAFITRGRRRAGKGAYHLTLADATRWLRECLLIWLPEWPMGSTHSPALAAQGSTLAAVARGRLWLGVVLGRHGEDTARHLALHALAVNLDLPMVASSDALMHEPARKPLLDVLTAIRLNTPLAHLGTRLAANAEQHLRHPEDLRRLHPPALLEESLRIAERCTFSLDELRYEYPKELVPEGMGPTDYLRALTTVGERQRWPQGVPAVVRAQIDNELALIAELKYEYYFLTVHDLVAWARAQGILCQGRGSAANSAVCFCLGITEVDPARMDLLFERFLSRERSEPPDIDVDFEHERREEVIQYIYRKYGRDHAALAATVISYRSRSARRDVGKALGLSPAEIEALVERLRENAQSPATAGLDRTTQLFLARTREILGFPRHLSQHVGGFVISRAPVHTLVPVENAAMPERSIIQWDKDDLETLRLLKVDVLALGMLTAIRKTLALVNRERATMSTGNRPLPALTMASLPAADAATYAMLQAGDSVGVFQVESRAQMAMLPRLKPVNFYDLVVQVAIVRPGPIQGGMVHPYLRRRAGEEDEDYPNPAVEAVLKRTLGVPIFQEQVIKLCVVAAGFTPGEADQLRRAMGRWQKTGELEQFRGKLIDGMRGNGFSLDYAERLYRQIEGFGEYGFPESHAASFALLVYVSAWLKRHHPAAFCCGLLNSLPMGFYSPSQLIQDARRHGVTVLPVDVDRSAHDCTLQNGALRLGLRQVAGFGSDAAQGLVAARAEKPFDNLQDLKTRARLDQRQLSALVAANAVTRLAAHRHQGHWEAQAIAGSAPLYAAGERADAGFLADGIALPPPDERANLLADYRSTGLTLNRHPMALLRERKPFSQCSTAAELGRITSGRFVRVAGVVTGRQRPGTASGILFMTVEDETGNVNVVVREALQERCRRAVFTADLVEVKGVLEAREGVVHLLAGEILDTTSALPGFATHSRDFR